MARLWANDQPASPTGPVSAKATFSGSVVAGAAAGAGAGAGGRGSRGRLFLLAAGRQHQGGRAPARGRPSAHCASQDIEHDISLSKNQSEVARTEQRNQILFPE
jgi:hypothetical protein